MKHPSHYYQEVTQLTTKTVFFRWSRSVLPFLTGALAIVAFFSGLLALPQMWQNYSTLEQKEKTLDQFTTEAQGLLNEMNRTIQVSEEQTRRLKTLATALPGPHRRASLPLLSVTGGSDYSIDPTTGFAVVNYDQIVGKK